MTWQIDDLPTAIRTAKRELRERLPQYRAVFAEVQAHMDEQALHIENLRDHGEAVILEIRYVRKLARLRSVRRGLAHPGARDSVAGRLLDVPYLPGVDRANRPRPRRVPRTPPTCRGNCRASSRAKNRPISQPVTSKRISSGARRPMT